MSSLSPHLELAQACVDARGELRRASQTLHDRVGGALAAAGLHLQLLRMDTPALASRCDELLNILNGVMEEVRALSRNIDPSPAGRTGLKNALLDLGSAGNGRVKVAYAASASIPVQAADALYLAAAAAVAAALHRKVKKVAVSSTGTKGLTLKIQHDGRAADARRDLAATAMLAEAAGLSFAIETKKGTIVSIRYAVRRTTGG